jgi:hypothetical protein
MATSRSAAHFLARCPPCVRLICLDACKLERFPPMRSWPRTTPVLSGPRASRPGLLTRHYSPSPYHRALMISSSSSSSSSFGGPGRSHAAGAQGRCQSAVPLPLDAADARRTLCPYIDRRHAAASRRRRQHSCSKEKKRKRKKTTNTGSLFSFPFLFFSPPLFSAR